MNRYIGGVLLMTIGAFIIIGGLSGNLAPMIAALFDPTDLTIGNPTGGSSGSGSGSGGTGAIPSAQGNIQSPYMGAPAGTVPFGAHPGR